MSLHKIVGYEWEMTVLCVTSPLLWCVYFFIPVLMILLPIMLLIIKLPGREERQILAVKNIYHYGKRKKLLALKNSTYALDDISSYVIS